jgi:hypothetical protein
MGLYRKQDGSIVSIPDEQAGPTDTPISSTEAASTETRVTPEDTGAVGALNAAATSTLSGLTLGLSDVALKGLLSKGAGEQLAAEREAHPVLSAGGQITGALLPALATGGALSATPAGYLSRTAARAAERAGGGLTGGLVAGGIEGAVQNAGIYLSDTALGDRELSAEGVVGALGTGLAFGSGGAAAAHGVVAGTIAARRMFARIADGGEKAATLAAQEWATKSQASLESFDQAADMARAQLATAQAAREQAELVRQQAVAGVAEARAAQVGGIPQAAEGFAVHAPERILDPEAAQKLLSNLNEYEAARIEFSDLHASVDPELEASLGGLAAPAVQAEGATIREPVSEFGPRRSGRAAPSGEASARIAIGSDVLPPEVPKLDVTRELRPARGTQPSASLGEVAAKSDAAKSAGIPDHAEIGAHERATDNYLDRTVPARDIAEQGYFEPPGGATDEVRIAKAKQAIAEGQRDPIKLNVSPEGKITVTDGRHRLAAAVEADAPIKVKWSTGTEPAADDVLRHGPADLRQLDARQAEIGSQLDAMQSGTPEYQQLSDEWDAIVAQRRALSDGGAKIQSAAPVKVGAASETAPSKIFGDSGVKPEIEPGNGEIKIKLTSPTGEAGHLKAVRDAQGVYRVKYTTIDPDLRGRGLANAMYRDLNDALIKEHGVPLASDFSRSPSAERVWEGLEKAGLAERKFNGANAKIGDARPDWWEMKSPRGAAAPADDLETLLRGTKAHLDSGEPLKSITPPWNEGFAGPGAGFYEGSAMAGDEARAQGQAMAERIARKAARPGYAVQRVERGHPMALRRLADAHESALERAAAATSTVEQQTAVAEAKAIEQQMTAVGARPGAVEDVAAMAKVVTRIEKAAAELTEAIGDVAPAAAKEAAQAFRAAEDEASRKTVSRIARAADDSAGDAAAAPEPAGPRHPTWSQRMANAKQGKLEADAAHARARATETEATLRSKAATKAAEDARAALPPSPVAGAPRTGLGSRAVAGAQAIGVGVEVAHDLGVPGVPSPHDIPVIGPMLSAYLKYRALKAATGRFMGRVPATAESRAAALAAKTKDAIASAVDRSLGLVARNEPIVKSTIVATGLRVNAALQRRAFDDGEPDAPKGSSTSQLAAVRMREVAAAATNPQLVVDKVSKEMRDLKDPDLINAMEAHMIAMYKHLNDTAPKGPPPNPYTKQQWTPSAADALQWGRRLAVANDPTVAFDALHARTLTPEAADTMRVVWQRLFALAQQRLIARAADVSKPVEYRQLIQNSLLFDVSLHPSMEPENAFVLRGAFAPAPAAAPTAPPGSPPMPSIAGSTNLSQAYRPDSDRRSAPR